MSNSCVNFVTRWAKNDFGIVTPQHRLSVIEWSLDEYAKKADMATHEIVSQIKEGNELVIAKVIDILTIQESYFFRDRALFAYLENHLLPEIINKARASGRKRIDIGSFGSSKGEEIYSIAMLLMELIPDVKSWDIFLFGIDINRFALEIAKQGKYTRLSLRAIEPRFKSKYFQEDNGTYYLLENVRKMVRFTYGNIVDSESMSLGFDLILCRNVFIYLDEAGITKSLEGFSKLLKDDSTLFLGPSEYSHFSKWFRKGFAQGVSFLTKADSVVTPSSKTSPIKKLTTKNSYVAKQGTRTSLIKEIKKLLKDKKHAKVLEQINANLQQFADDSLLNQYKVRALLELGDTLSARELLDDLLKKDGLNATNHFLLGLACSEEDNSLSMEHYKKAIYLNTCFPEAYYYLANIYFSKQDVINGLLYLDKGIRYAEAKAGEDQALVGDCDYATLLSILKKEREHYAR